jgi:hypothetical protein
MNDDRTIPAAAHQASDALAAELTAAAYPIALRHGVKGKWLDLELDLWRVLAETIKKWEPRIAQALRPPETLHDEERRSYPLGRMSLSHA